MQVPRKRPDVGNSRKKFTGGGSLQNGVTPKKARKLRAGLLALVVALAMVVAIPGFAQGIVDGVRAAFGVETLAEEGQWASDRRLVRRQERRINRRRRFHPEHRSHLDG